MKNLRSLIDNELDADQKNNATTEGQDCLGNFDYGIVEACKNKYKTPQIKACHRLCVDSLDKQLKACEGEPSLKLCEDSAQAKHTECISPILKQEGFMLCHYNSIFGDVSLNIGNEKCSEQLLIYKKLSEECNLQHSKIIKECNALDSKELCQKPIRQKYHSCLEPCMEPLLKTAVIKNCLKPYLLCILKNKIDYILPYDAEIMGGEGETYDDIIEQVEPQIDWD